MIQLQNGRSMRAQPGHSVRFRIFIQTGVVEGFEEPETISLPAYPGEIGPGPHDDRFYTITPAVAKEPYDPPHSFPPYDGPMMPPAMPDAQGHFDHIPVDAPEFPAVHTYAISRLTLTTWERYLGREIPWAFPQQRMELVPDIDWTNAHSGWGFIELGHSSKRADGQLIPFWMNFDVIAHEMGHAILFSLMELSPDGDPDREYRTFHETGSDVIGFVTAMQSDRLLRHVLEKSEGNIYGLNELNRLGEVSEYEHIRALSNEIKVDAVRDAEVIHHYSLPLTGAFFDIFAVRYIRALERLDAIPAEIAERIIREDWPDVPDPEIDALIRDQYNLMPDVFEQALRIARDEFGTMFAQILPRLPADNMSFLNTANVTLQVHRALFSEQDDGEIAEIFLWRGIGSRYLA